MPRSRSAAARAPRTAARRRRQSARASAVPPRTSAISSALSKLFGFVQFDFAGTLGLADGRYLARAEADGAGGDEGPGAGGESPNGGGGGSPADEGEHDEAAQSVLVLLTTGAPAPGRRRRRKGRDAEAESPADELPLTRATAVRAFAPFDGRDEALGWLEAATATDEAADAVIEEGAFLLNRALHTAGMASGEPFAQERDPWSAAAVRIGFGTGDEVAESRFTEARSIDIRSGSGARRRRDELRPQERIAAVLGSRESLDACETLCARARRDLDAGRLREAALQLRVGLEALLIELQGAMSDPGHDEDMAVLAERRKEAGVAANQALKGVLDAESRENVRELIEIGERVLRRRRILHG